MKTRLRQLIINKYGEAKYALGQELVARWVSYETNKPFTMEQVQQLCSKRPLMGINAKQGEALRKLFGLQSVEQIYG